MSDDNSSTAPDTKNTDNPQKPTEKNSTKKVIAGIAIGGAIGSLLGIIFAPRKGSETRKMIKRGFMSRIVAKIKDCCKRCKK